MTTPPQDNSNSAYSTSMSGPTVTIPNEPPPSNSNNTQAIIALVLGILAITCCGLLTGIPAIFVARAELKAIEEGRSSRSNYTMAKIGLILGIVGTIFTCLVVLAYILLGVFTLIPELKNHSATF